MSELTCFKAYDIRGKLGEELNTDIAYRIGRAYAEFLKPESVVLGGDVRETSEELKEALANGIRDAVSDVIDIGMTGTEEVYFAVQHLGVDGGIEVTASHNPIDYNGMKPVRKGARPLSSDSGLLDIKKLAESYSENKPPINDTVSKGSYRKLDILSSYVEHLLTYVDIKNIKPMKLVVNSGNGAAGHVVDEIEALAEDEAKLLPKDLLAAIEYVKEIDLTSGNTYYFISIFINYRISRMQSKSIEDQKRID